MGALFGSDEETTDDDNATNSSDEAHANHSHNDSRSDLEDDEAAVMEMVD